MLRDQERVRERRLVPGAVLGQYRSSTGRALVPLAVRPERLRAMTNPERGLPGGRRHRLARRRRRYSSRCRSRWAAVFLTEYARTGAVHQRSWTSRRTDSGAPRASSTGCSASPSSCRGSATQTRCSRGCSCSRSCSSHWCYHQPRGAPNVPDEYRDASAALGVSRWQTIRSVVFPAAMPGVITGTILGVGRIAGETAPILLVMSGGLFPTDGPRRRSPVVRVHHHARRSSPTPRTASAHDRAPLPAVRGITAGVEQRHLDDFRGRPRSSSCSWCSRFYAVGIASRATSGGHYDMSESTERPDTNRDGTTTNAAETTTGETDERSTRSGPTTASTGRAKVRAEDLNVHYGDDHALKDISMDDPREERDGADRAVRLWEVDVPPVSQPDERPDQGARASTGTSNVDGEDIYADGANLVELRKRVGMVFQQPNPFPKSIRDNISYGPRKHGDIKTGLLAKLFDRSSKEKERRTRRALAPSGGDLGRGEGPPRRQRARALRWPTATSLHRPLSRRRSRRSS